MVAYDSLCLKNATFYLIVEPCCGGQFLHMAGHPMCDGSGQPFLSSRDDLDPRRCPEIPHDFCLKQPRGGSQLWHGRYREVCC